MKYYFDDLIAQIRMRLNLPATDPEFPAAFKTATLPLDDFVATVIEESVREVVNNTPPSLYPEPKELSGRLDWQSDFDCALTLPDDFNHLVAFRMSGWKRNVTRLILPEDPDIALLSSPYRFVRGTPCRPRCYLVREQSVNRLIACTSERREEVMEVGLYVPLPTATGHAHQRYIEFPAQLANDVIGVAAKLVKDNLITY